MNEIEIEKTISYNHIPHFPISTVESHFGQLIFGKIEGRTWTHRKWVYQKACPRDAWSGLSQSHWTNESIKNSSQLKYGQFIHHWITGLFSFSGSLCRSEEVTLWDRSWGPLYSDWTVSEVFLPVVGLWCHKAASGRLL